MEEEKEEDMMDIDEDSSAAIIPLPTSIVIHPPVHFTRIISYFLNGENMLAPFNPREMTAATLEVRENYLNNETLIFSLYDIDPSYPSIPQPIEPLGILTAERVSLPITNIAGGTQAIPSFHMCDEMGERIIFSVDITKRPIEIIFGELYFFHGVIQNDDNSFSTNGELFVIKKMELGRMFRRTGSLRIHSNAPRSLIYHCQEDALREADYVDTNTGARIMFFYKVERYAGVSVYNYMDSAITHYLKTKDASHYPSENIVIQILRQILLGLQHLRSYGVCHFDLSPENIVFTVTDGVVSLKIIDFGQAFFEPARNMTGIVPPKSMYVPPELYPKTPAVFDGHKSDLWRFAITAFLLLVGNYAWESGPHTDGRNNEYMELVNGNFRALIEDRLVKSYNPHLIISEKAKRFLEFIFIIDPTMRPSVEQMLDHDFLRR